MLAGKRILLIVGGGIAAYKSLETTRRLRETGASVVPVLTRAGKEFVTPLSLSAIAGNKVHCDLFDLTDEAEMGHIELSRSADLVVVAPATADLMARMASGRAEDLASTLLLATDKPVLCAPAMNVRMWEHPATRRNQSRLAEDGVMFVGPEEGEMACGEYGFGRMAEPQRILEAIAEALGASGEAGASGAAGPLSGHRALVTSGPTREPIDPVRYIANRSSGAQGAAIGAALASLGADVSFVTGPADVASPAGVGEVRVETARQMLEAAMAALPVSVAICAAAVADWRAADVAEGKLKKSSGNRASIELVENPDILAEISRMKEGRPRLVVGFAAETENVVEQAVAKRRRKGCDWIVANDVRPETGIMGGEENEIHLITETGAEAWPRMGKDAVASRLASMVAKALAA